MIRLRGKSAKAVIGDLQTALMFSSGTLQFKHLEVSNEYAR